MGAETLCCGIFPFGVSHFAGDFSFSESPSDISLMVFLPLKTQILAYGLPSFEPIGGWTPGSFPLLGSFHIPMMEFFSGDSSVDGISPTREDNFADGFTLMLEVPDRHRVGVPIRDRHIQSVDEWYPHFRPIFCRSNRTMATYGTRLFMTVSSFRLFSWCISLIWSQV